MAFVEVDVRTEGLRAPSVRQVARKDIVGR